MTVYWTVYEPEDKLTRFYKCDTCKAFKAPENRKKAVVELRGNENAEHAAGMLIRLCETHFQELKDAGEVEGYQHHD